MPREPPKWGRTLLFPLYDPRRLGGSCLHQGPVGPRAPTFAIHAHEIFVHNTRSGIPDTGVALPGFPTDSVFFARRQSAIVEDLSGLGSLLARADDAPFFQLVDQASGTGVADAQPTLKKRD